MCKIQHYIYFLSRPIFRLLQDRKELHITQYMFIQILGIIIFQNWNMKHETYNLDWTS